MYMGPVHRSFRSNLNLSADKDDGASFEDISQQAKQLYPRIMSSSWQVAEEGEMEIGGHPTYVLCGTYRKGPLNLRTTQFFVRAKGKVYILTFTTPTAAFDGLSSAIAQSAKSIRIE
jgi:hypothetical protein